MLASGTTDLNTKLRCNCFEARPVLGKLGQMNVHRGAECGSKVGRARGDIAQVVVVRETGASLNLACGGRKTSEHSTDVSTILHGDDTKLVLFVDPDKESLGVVVENSSAMGPVTVQADSLEETIAFSIQNKK